MKAQCQCGQSYRHGARSDGRGGRVSLRRVSTAYRIAGWRRGLLPEVLDGRAPDPLASQIANAAPVELPPAIAARATLRCGDNSLVYVDFFQGEELANFRAEQGDAPRFSFARKPQANPTPTARSRSNGNAQAGQR